MPRPISTVISRAILANVCALMLTNCSKPPKAPPPTVVQTMTVAGKTVPELIDTSATITSVKTVEVRAQTDGLLQSVHIKDGQEVRKGDLLFTIDPRPLRAASQQASGTLIHDQALLADAVDSQDRDKTSREFDGVSVKTYQTAVNTANALKGTVVTDQGALEQARLSLAYTNVRSPVNGRVGAILVQPGNLVSAGSSTDLVVVNTVSPIDAKFELPQVQVDALHKAIRDNGGQPLSVSAINPVTNEVLGKGTLDFFDNAFDTTSGTLELKARFSNADGAMWPGEFVKVRVTLKIDNNALTIPESALQQGQNGAYVYCVIKGKAVVRNIKVARIVDGQAVVSGGLSAGEKVVVAVPNDLRDGSAVTDNPKAAAAGTEKS